MRLWNTIKSGVSKFGRWAGNKAKKFGNFLYDHREGIGIAIGAGLDIASNFGVPGANIASKVVKGFSKAVDNDFTKGIKEGSSLVDKNKKPIPQESNNSYSLNTKASGGTKEGRMFNSYRSFR